MLEEGKQVLYLLPEIALTTQIITRLTRVFGESVGVYHSKFSDAQRTEVYNRMLGGDYGGSSSCYKLILGVRSSVFLPFTNLGLVIVDEEHENTYKQYDPAPRYHGMGMCLVQPTLTPMLPCRQVGTEFQQVTIPIRDSTVDICAQLPIAILPLQRKKTPLL